MQQPPDSDQRKYFRLRYPVTERPIIRSGDRDFEVAEISEGGVRIIVTGGMEFEPGGQFSGSILFADGEILDIRGLMLRSMDGEIVVRLSQGISFKRMVAEQALLKQKLTWVFDAGAEE